MNDYRERVINKNHHGSAEYLHSETIQRYHHILSWINPPCLLPSKRERYKGVHLHSEKTCSPKFLQTSIHIGRDINVFSYSVYFKLHYSNSCPHRSLSLGAIHILCAIISHNRQRAINIPATIFIIRL